MADDLMSNCAIPMDPNYARAYRVWKQNPPLEMLQSESEPPCAYCAKPTQFGSPILLSHGVGWLHDLRPCACGEWHYCCYACVKSLELAASWQLKRAPNRDVARMKKCPVAIRVAHEFMGIDVSAAPLVASTQKVKAQWRLSQGINDFGECS